MRELVVSMLHGKTVVLHNLGRRGEALPVLNQPITCFQDDENTNIQMVVSDARRRDADVFVCGPNPFVETVTRLLGKAKHDPRRIRTERFGSQGGSS